MDIRPAEDVDLPLLEEIERAADRAFVDLFAAPDWPAASPGEWRARQQGFLLVAGRPAVGFAHVMEVEGEAHLEQLAVHPAHQRAGVGSALVRAAKREAASRGYDSLSLRTYRDIAWNAPFYQRFGFVAEAPRTEFQRGLVDKELAMGLMDHGTRVLMRSGLALA
jgi:GNAT superfamily N-acetyltransferase